MYFFNQQFLTWNKALTFNSDEQYVNTDSFNAYEKFNDIYENSIKRIYQKYELPAFHIWEDGFTQGDATNEELEDILNEMDFEDSNELFEFLDRKLILEMKDDVEKLIKEFQKFIKENLEK